ncbi:MAG TPA: S9 family peptidase, partial [Thermoanaerobaculia bacterium]|nr:S9 family peptidase [Thermoanaerobaculia bacterium]
MACPRIPAPARRLRPALALWAFCSLLLSAAPRTATAQASQASQPSQPSRGQEAAPLATGYRTPVQALVDVTDAPRTPAVLLAPGRQWLVVLSREELPPLRELAQRELRLAGLRIDPRVDAPSRRPYFTGMRLVRLADGTERPVSGLPQEPRIGRLSWSPDGTRAAFTLTGRDGVELWVLEVGSGAARQLSPARLSLVLDSSPAWLDNRTLLLGLVPAGRGAEPSAPEVPAGPVEQQTAGRAAPARTYQDLLKNTYDEALFEHYATVQLARLDLDGKLTPLGSPGLHRASPSPDGRYLLVETYHRPFSYLVPLERFPLQIEVWDREGVKVHQVADLPLREEVPIAFDSVPAGPRFVHWRADAPATLAWIEALDGGDSTRKADLRDAVQLLPAPFTASPRTLARVGYRVSSLAWGNGGLALLSEHWWKTRRTRTWWVQPDAPAAQAELLFDRSS